ncbi:MAG: hypothetical protein SFY92_05210 [Verrucomicrobiae bacterium]|nr:hypothetical protein [Verrucomicrobiae bacterium]
MPPPPSPKERLILCLIVGGVGLFLILSSLGIINLPPPRRPRKALFEDPRHWEITAFGLAFLLAGLSLLPDDRHMRLKKMFGTLSALPLLAGMTSVLLKIFQWIR